MLICDTDIFQYLLSHICCFSGGKRDENLILPLNDSVSATLSTKQVSSCEISGSHGGEYKDDTFLG
jgi:hypothetical protein